MTTVTWVKDVNDFYEVSSPEHLIQIMNAGSKYTNAGDVPTSFTSTSAKFLQTVDIDLGNYHEHITPFSANWYGTYDGGNHAIANWEYHQDLADSGFFSSLRGQFKNSRLTGVWKLGGTSSYKGFVAGVLQDATSRIDNVKTYFEPGTEITGRCSEVGGFVGRLQTGAYISGCILSGTIETTDTGYASGGFVGQMSNGNMTYCANYATFPKGIKCAGRCGGIVGNVYSGWSDFHNLVNGMTGDIGDERSAPAGGIAGGLATGSTSVTDVHSLVNVMMGNITTLTIHSGTSGGIIGTTSGNGSYTMSKFVNYMVGDIVGNSTGGLIAKMDNSTSSTVSLENSIVAMNGNVQHDAVVRSILRAENTASATVNTDFGFTFTSNAFSSSDALVDFVTDDVFTLLPYVPMSGTSEEGAAISFNPSFANLGGLDPASPFARYTTLTIHTSPEIYYPYYVSMGFSEVNTTKYYTYGEITPHKVTLRVDDAITGPFTTASQVDSIFNVSDTLLKGLLWTQNVSNEYEVSTASHLVQLMSKGAVYDDTGAFPADYMTATFFQTSDIDLSGKEAVIAPIGDDVDPFTGVYSGGLNTISSWKYDRGVGSGTDDGTGVYMGLFGTVDGGNISDLKLGGLWSMAGSCSAHGLLVGRLTGTSVRVAGVETDFQEGTSISSGHATSSACGILIGMADGDCQITGLSLRGRVSYKGSDSILGGVVGSISDGASLSWVENGLTLTDGLGPFNAITDAVTGGIVGTFGTGASSAWNLSNNSSGDISGGKCGGIVGSCATGEMTRADTWANAMTGHIVGSTCAGGIIGEFEALSVDVSAVAKVTNYMHGDITSGASGGVIGRTVDSSSGSAPAIQCTNSIVAMRGTVGDTVVGQAGHPVSVAVNVNQDFGIAFTTNTYATTDPLVGYDTFPGFPLPFLSMTGTESGLTHDREIVFPNVGGAAETSPLFEYDSAVIYASSTTYVPFLVEFGFAPDSTRYIAYAKVSDSELYVDPLMATVISSTAEHVMDYDGKSKFGFLPPILNDQTNFDNIQIDGNRRHSWTHYTDEYAIGATNGSATGAFDTINLGGASGTSNFSVSLRPLGTVYNQEEKKIYFINASNNKFVKKGIDGSADVTVAEDATYYTICGDASNQYMFGSRLFGGFQQVFRVNADGTNMTTANVIDLIGSNIEVNQFTSNRDDERIYFSEATGNTVYSLSWGLDDIQTMPFKLAGERRARENKNSIFYHQGMIYFGNNDPLTETANSLFYAYDMDKEGYRVLEGRSLNMSGTRGRNHIYVHDGTNRLLISSSYGTGTFLGTNFDFHTEYITRGKQYTDGYEFSWVPIEGATSYQVHVNGVTATTTGTTYTTRGHEDEAILQINLSYSTDDVTYVVYKYAYTSFTVEAKFTELVTPPNYPYVANGSMTWLDPYNPTEVMYSKGDGVVVLNVSTLETTPYSVPGITMLGRSFTTKDIIGLANDRFYNFGPNAKNILDSTVPPLPPPFYIHPAAIQHMHLCFTGLIYFTVKTSNEVWSVNIDGTGATLLFTLNGTATSLATDPYNPNTLVYGDGTDLVYRDLSTDASRVVLTGAKMALNNGIVVLDDVIYTTYRWQNEGYIRVNIDGVTDYFQGPRSWGVGTLVDTVNQAVYDFTIGNYTVYYDGTYTIAALPADPSSMVVSVTPLGMRASWAPIAGATSYKIQISEGSDGENSAVTRYTTSNTNPKLTYTHTLPSESTHTVYLRYDTDTETDLLSSSRTIEVPAMSTDPADFSKDFFLGDDGKFDITKIKVDLGAVMNAIFESGDDIQVKLPGGKEVKTKFVKRGGTVPISEGSAISIPFTKDAGGGQSVSITLSDSSSVEVAYDETSEQLTVGGVSYSSGDSFVIDGKKVTIVDV